MKGNRNKILAIAFIGLILVSCHDNKKSGKMENENTTSLFPKGDRLPNDWFTGEAFLSPLVAKDKNNEFLREPLRLKLVPGPIGIHIRKDRF